MSPAPGDGGVFGVGSGEGTGPGVATIGEPDGGVRVSSTPESAPPLTFWNTIEPGLSGTAVEPSAG